MQSEYVDGLPNLCGDEEEVRRARAACSEAFRPHSDIDFGRVRAAWGIALHMQQPLIPAGGSELSTARIISNLKHMWDNQGVGDNHNAPVFHWCYKRIGEFVPELAEQGKSPRVMLDYSGCLFHGLRDMGLHDVFDSLRRVTAEPAFNRCVEWLGCPWGHAVAPSTPIQDYARHVSAWRHHFAAIFGLDAAARVRGFSPAEMALPNHPDVAYAFVKTLRDEGYLWVLAQEHTLETDAGGGLERAHIPHRLVCRNSKGEEISILCLIKTQGSDTKLVAQMQPCYEARSLSRQSVAGRDIPPFVVQIGDGENGGVMMNEFPQPFKQTMAESSGSDAPAMNGTEYLEFLLADGFREEDFPVARPKWTKLLFESFERPDGDAVRLAKAIEEAKKRDHRFNMEGGSWTNNISWVQGYENLLGPMEKASVLFNERAAGADSRDPRRRNALFHLLCSQTSCYRYWGQGIWTDYGREICRRLEAILRHDFPEPAAPPPSPPRRQPAPASAPPPAPAPIPPPPPAIVPSPPPAEPVRRPSGPVLPAADGASHAKAKRKALRELLRQWRKPLVAFSGGVDSSLLARAARDECPGVELALLTGPLFTADAAGRARAMAAELALPLREAALDALAIPAVAANPRDRCYHCKHAGFSLLRAMAENAGFDILLDGRHASDQGDYRPGARAAAELGARSPLAEAGLTKDGIRDWARELGLSNWDRPADACLATRVPTDRALDALTLAKVEKAEAWLSGLGLRHLRARVAADGVRLEVHPDDIAKAAAGGREEIAAAMERIGFKWVAVDLRGYRPSGGA